MDTKRIGAFLSALGVTLGLVGGIFLLYYDFEGWWLAWGLIAFGSIELFGRLFYALPHPQASDSRPDEEEKDGKSGI